MERDRRILMLQVSQAWGKAAQLLKFEAIAPYSISVEDQVLDCVAFVPDFGGVRGTIVGILEPPDLRTDKRLSLYAKEHGLFYSFLNPEEYATYNEARFKETLFDWGFFGPASRRPEWLVECN
jgi:hypothetical protein